MEKIPHLQVITTKRSSTDTWKNRIERKSLLKTKLKLLQIEQFDRDLRVLHEHNLSLSHIGLEDFNLNKFHNLFVPIMDRIIPLKEKNNIKLKSYLIYLSYLYNYNFLECLKNPNHLYRTIFSLEIEEELKQSLFRLLNQEEALYFSDYMDALRNLDFRERLIKDRIRLNKQ